MIKSIYFNKTSYQGNFPVYLIIESDRISTCKIEIFYLQNLIKSFEENLVIGDNKIRIGEFKNKIAGYLTIVRCEKDIFSTAFSVDPKGSIVRYGFLSDFEKNDDNSDVKWLNLNHINYVQFYDWSYHHDKMVSTNIEYFDSMGKKNNLNVIKNKISICKRFDMKTMAYGPIYAATEDYFIKHKEQAYYANKDTPLTFIDIFYFMNLDNPDWVKHILQEYKQSIKNLGFSGIHLDTYGYPKRALDFEGKTKYLDKDIYKFLGKISNELNQSPLIFNNVGAWPLKQLAYSNQVATYIELWPPYETFFHLKEIINFAKSLLKPIVIAAYLQSFRLKREFAFYNLLLVTYFINSLGATHLFLGEEGGILTQGYYCDYTKLKNKEKEILLKYQNFFVMYQSLLFDFELKDVTMTHCGWDNEEYKIYGNYSLTCEANKISVVIRTNGKKHLICLLNLEDNDDIWNKEKNEPKLCSPLEITIQVFKNVKNVYFAEPDLNFGKPKNLEFIREKGKRSDVVRIDCPSFKVGAIIYFEEE